MLASVAMASGLAETGDAAQGAAVALECAEAGGPEVPDEAPQAGQAQGFPNAEDCPPVHSLTEGI